VRFREAGRVSGRAQIRERLGRLWDAKWQDEDRRRLDQLEQRLEHLEALVEGLQDAVHRDSIRHEQRMAELERRTEPEAVAKALSDDARRRGL
jgi:predicted  nucleic acid-binding Zn-ribbon protein